MDEYRSDMEEKQFIDNYTSWFNNNYGITGTGEEPASLFDMRNLYPVSDPDSPLEETAYQVQQGTQSGDDYRYWLPEYDSCCGVYWGDELFSGGRYYSDDDGCSDLVLNTEDADQNEDQHQSYTSYWGDGFSQPDCDYNPWSNHRRSEDEDSYSYDGNEPRTTYGYRMDEMGLCEGIFGYFPCLLRDQKEYNNMQ
ncbi:hypothetical protein PTKIN_Ptkin06aG0031500 [Pterospermum kingtungense]